MSSYLRDWLEANNYVIVVREVPQGIQIEMPQQLHPTQYAKESRTYTYDKATRVLSCRSDVVRSFTVSVPVYAVRLALALEIKSLCKGRGYDPDLVNSLDKDGNETTDWPLDGIEMTEEERKLEDSLRRVFVEGAPVDYNTTEGYDFLVKVIGVIK